MFLCNFVSELMLFDTWTRKIQTKTVVQSTDWLMLHNNTPTRANRFRFGCHYFPFITNYLLMHFKDMNIHLTQSVLKMSIHFMKMAWDWTWYIIFGRYKYANISEARNTNVVNEWTRSLNVSQISARITDWSKCTLDSYANTTNTHTPQKNHIWCESAKLFFSSLSSNCWAKTPKLFVA